jgi:chaperonin GroES
MRVLSIARTVRGESHQPGSEARTARRGANTRALRRRSTRRSARVRRFEDDGPQPSEEVRILATATATSTKLRPLGDRVVVKPTPREEMTKTGIVLPDTAKEKPQEGTVVAAGPGRTLDDGKREAMDVKEGQKVLYAKYAGTEFKIDGDELLIVSQKDILAIVED